MSVIIPSLTHAACKVIAQPDPVLVAAVGVRAVERTFANSAGQFNVILDQTIDPRTALLLATANAITSEPLGGIHAFMDDNNPGVVRVITSQSVIASANVSSDGNTIFGSGIEHITKAGPGEYDIVLQRPLRLQSGLYVDATILVTPGLAQTIPSWLIIDESSFKIFMGDGAAGVKDSPFSMSLVPNDPASHGFDVSFTLHVMDLSATGVVPITPQS